MKRRDMICLKCIKYDGKNCRLAPKPTAIDDPVDHWCAQGLWLRWSEEFDELVPCQWGEWDLDLVFN